jgi:ATP-binding cassette subfamily C (CFTR/MRP) protein 4
MAAVLGAVILIGILNPWSFIPAVIGIIGMLIVRYRFSRCSRDLKRLAELTRSPMYSYLSSTIHGLKVIRSYHAEQMCSKEFLSYLDNHSRASFLTEATERWAAMRFDGILLIFFTLVTIFSMLVRIYKQELSTADIALTLSYSLSLMGLFEWTIRFAYKSFVEFHSSIF